MIWRPIDTLHAQNGDECLIWDGDGIYLANFYEGDWWVLSEFTVDCPTHWMPLPQPPESSPLERLDLLAERMNELAED